MSTFRGQPIPPSSATYTNSSSTVTTGNQGPGSSQQQTGDALGKALASVSLAIPYFPSHPPSSLCWWVKTNFIYLYPFWADILKSTLLNMTFFLYKSTIFRRFLIFKPDCSFNHNYLVACLERLKKLLKNIFSKLYCKLFIITSMRHLTDSVK